MSSWEIEAATYGVDELLAKMERMAGTATFSARLGAVASSGQVRRTRGGEHTETLTRTAGQNVIVLRSQAKSGRDVAFLKSQEVARIWQEGINRFMRSDATTDDALMQAAKDICALAVASTRKHIDDSENRGGGRVEPCKPGTNARKKRETGRDDLPPLMRTGQLYRSLVAEGKKR